jgi:alanyl-tRNA synthetase
VRVLEEIAAASEAEKLIVAAQTGADGLRVVTQLFDARDAESLKKLAHALIANSQTVVLLGSRDSDTARLVFARSADATADMNALMREACVQLDGRGGGKADMAQGGGKNVNKLSDVLELAKRRLSPQ